MIAAGRTGPIAEVRGVDGHPPATLTRVWQPLAESNLRNGVGPWLSRMLTEHRAMLSDTRLAADACKRAPL